MAGIPIVKEQILRILQGAGERGVLLRDIVHATGLTYDQVSGCLLRLRVDNLAHRGSYISRSEMDGRGKIPAYWVLGAGKDAPYPVLSPSAAAKAMKENKARYRKKYRAVLNLKARVRRGQKTNPWQGLL